jgi:hypothetical protein
LRRVSGVLDNRRGETMLVRHQTYLLEVFEQQYYQHNPPELQFIVAEDFEVLIAEVQLI